MRIVLAAAVFIAALAVEQGPASAREAPWCAVFTVGRGSVYWDCRYNSVEECQPDVISGNRGFCNMNPGYVAPAARIAPKARKKRHARRH
jgi:hypothetical protein